MKISRRDLLRSSVAVGGVTALGGLGTGLADAAVAGTATSTRAGSVAGTTAAQVLLKSEPGVNGWRTVVTGPGEPHVLVESLGAKAKKGRANRRTALVSFAQISDVHICDSQSPMRLEPYDGIAGGSSAYRPQEILGAHVADAMVRRINEVGAGPVLGQPLRFAIQTGDNSDNNQLNEIRWNIDVLDGGELQVDSGDLSKYEGVADNNDPTFYHPYYWHPDGTPEGKTDDIPRATYGFPTVPGLLDAARAPFQAEGFAIPWYTAMGNHDGIPQGSVTPTAGTEAKAVGTDKTISVGPTKTRTVTADPDRTQLTKAEWVAEHFNTPELPGPVGHGLTQDNLDKGTAYYSFDRGKVRFVVLDSVNPNGSETGSLNKAQFTWLKKLLENSKRKLIVLASHHTIATMTNSRTEPIELGPRVLGPEIRSLLLKYDNVIAWVNGHTHDNNIWAHRRKDGTGFWEINTASHIDWPQQARLLEIADNKDGTLSIFTTMVDHAADLEFSGALNDPPDPVDLAALSRLLSANDWQTQGSDPRGSKKARNAELVMRAPAFMR